MERYWSVFGLLKNKLFSVLREGFYQLNVSKDEVRPLIHEDEEFSSYADKIDNAFMEWRSAVDKELRSINAYINAKDLIVRLAEQILIQFEGVELIDKYDVYQVLLQNLNKEKVSNVTLYKPDIEEQQNIASILSDMDEEISGYEAKLAKYIGIKQGMMSELLTGRIRLIDKEDA